MPSKVPRKPGPEVVDATRIEEQLAEKLIGQRIRGFRLGRSMGLAELGKLSGLSASYISQLETGRVVPTLRNLARIALVFNKDLAWFFEPRAPVVFRTLRKEDRIPITRKLKKNSRFISESLSSLIPDRHIVPCLAEFHPKGGECEFTPKIFRGTEFLFLIEGEIEILLADERHTLEAGDICWIDASRSRQYLCVGARTAKAIIVTEHPK
jgi:transcriptional regulator with XRE-family HTH domain